MATPTERLSTAAKYGDLPELESALKAGARVESQNSEHWTALIWTARHGHSACLERLISAGANVHAEDWDGVSAAMWAAQYEHSDCALMIEAEMERRALMVDTSASTAAKSRSRLRM